MNPSEKIKSILDGLTQPLYKDNPFETGGRCVDFDTSSETRSLSFQAFVNRINTFKPGNWGSDPNGALYLAKHGFLAASGCKVCCCSCLVEVDMAIFMGKPEILQTIAVKSHKQTCRWLSVTTPSVYFKIPSNPLRTVENFKVTLGDLMSVGPALPIIQKRTYVKMGLTEDIVSAVLHSFGNEVTDALASALVLSLCGWVKNTDSSLQCNFCRRVVGTWNFFGVDNNSSELPINTKQQRVVSLLYNEIRRSMIPHDTDDAESNKMDGDPQHTPIIESVEHIESFNCNDEQGDVDEAFEFNYSNNQRSNGLSSSVFAHMLKKKALKYLSSKSQRDRRYISELLWLKIQRAARKQSNQDQAIAKAVDSRPASESDMEEEKTELYHDSKEHSDASNGESVNIVNKQLQVDLTCNSSNVASSTENGFHVMEHENSEESCVTSVQPSVSPHTACTSNDDKCCHSETTSEVKSPSNTIDCLDANVHSKSISSKEMNCSSCLSEKLHVNISHDDCDTQVKSNKCDQFDNHNSLNNSCDSPSIQSVVSEQSSLSTEKPGEILKRSEGRRKRKRIPSHERNGTSFNSDLLPRLPAQLEPAHYTRSKKKELEMLLNEQRKLKLESNVEKGVFVEIHRLSKEDLKNVSTVVLDQNNANDVDHAEENANSVHHAEESMNAVNRDEESVNNVDQDEKNVKAVDIDEKNVNIVGNMEGNVNAVDDDKGNAVDHDVENVMTLHHEVNNPLNNELTNSITHGMEDTGQSQLILSNLDENVQFSPVIYSVTGNAVIPMDTLEETDDKNQNMQNRNDFQEGPIIVSSKSVCSEEMFQDYVAEEGRNLENGYIGARRTFSNFTSNGQKCENLSCNDTENNAQKNVSDSSVPFSVQTSLECSVSGKDVDNTHVERCKRKREETDESNNHISKKPNFEDYKLELCKTYFHPELEHRYWCIWRIKLADFLGVSNDPKKGWEHYLQAVQKGLELMNTEKISLYQAESEVKTLRFIADTLAISRYRK